MVLFLSSSNCANTPMREDIKHIKVTHESVRSCVDDSLWVYLFPILNSLVVLLRKFSSFSSYYVHLEDSKYLTRKVKIAGLSWTTGKAIRGESKEMMYTCHPSRVTRSCRCRRSRMMMMRLISDGFFYFPSSSSLLSLRQQWAKEEMIDQHCLPVESSTQHEREHCDKERIMSPSSPLNQRDSWCWLSLSMSSFWLQYSSRENLCIFHVCRRIGLFFSRIFCTVYTCDLEGERKIVKRRPLLTGGKTDNWFSPNSRTREFGHGDRRGRGENENILCEGERTRNKNSRISMYTSS